MSELPLATLWKRSQGALIDFLNADIDLAFTFLRTAAIDSREDLKHRELALTKARSALEAVRRFEGSVASALAWSEIHARAEELEVAIRGFRTN